MIANTRPGPVRPGFFLPARDWAWPALCAALAILTIATHLVWPGPALVLDTAHWTAQPWTLWTGPLVHLHLAHLMANLCALAAVGWLGQSLGLGMRSVLAATAAWPLGSLLLLAWPGSLMVWGLSGILHAMVAIMGLHGLQAGAARQRMLAGLLLLGLVLKLLLEQAWAVPVASTGAWPFPVVAAAHLAGFGAGLLCAASASLADLLHERRRRVATHEGNRERATSP